MTPVQTAQLAITAARKELSAHLSIAEEHRSAEWLSELETKTQRVASKDAEMSAAVLVEEPVEQRSVESSEGREYAEMRSKVSFGDYVKAAIEMRSADGAAAEYNQHLGIAGNAFPLSVFDGLETRARRDGDAGASQGTWLDRIFAQSAAQYLGVTFSPVASGVAAFPVTSVGGSPVQRGRTEAVSESTYTIAVTEMKPSRATVYGKYSIEDEARLPGMAAAIERDMRAAMVERIDRSIFIGDTGANENTADITGLQTAGISEKTLTQANKIKADKTLELFVDFVDGRYASSLGDVRIVSSVGANKLWSSTIHNSTVSNETIAQFLRNSGVTWTTRGSIETNTVNGDFGAFVGLSRGNAGAARAAVWESATLIRDPYSGKTKGEVHLILNYLWAFAIPRTANYKRLKFVT